MITMIATDVYISTILEEVSNSRHLTKVEDLLNTIKVLAHDYGKEKSRDVELTNEEKANEHLVRYLRALLESIVITSKKAALTYVKINKDLNKLRAVMINDVYYRIKLLAAELNPEYALDGDAGNPNLDIDARLESLRELYKKKEEEKYEYNQ